MKLRAQTGVVFLLLFASACLEQYNLPREANSSNGYLIVDGYLDGNNGAATVTLARSVDLVSYSPNPSETEAEVSVETEAGGTFPLKEGANGLYTGDHLLFDPRMNYRLHVVTKDGKSYTSDYIKMKQSPSFDSVVWRAEEQGIRFFVNGHDDSGQTKYYKYLYNETWSYGVPFVSHYKNIGGLPVKRNKNELVSDCWISRSSGDVLVKSTNNISKDAVIMFPIFFLSRGTRKLQDVYSVIVEQRAISEAEYSFWEMIRKTNDSMGGLFDPLPSAVVGNVRSENDSSEPVLGYFSGGFPKQIRIFLTLSELPKYLQDLDALSFECGVDDFIVGGTESIGTQIFLDVHIWPSLYFVTSANCGDCRSLGGDTIRPKFWPQ